ncbi:MAG: alginate lyase family protein [Polyangiaceae bacterium]
MLGPRAFVFGWLMAGSSGCVSAPPPCVSSPPVSSARFLLHDPYERLLASRLAPPTTAAPQQSSVPPPMRDVLGVSYYSDAAHSVVDEALRQQNERQLAPLRSMIELVNRQSDVWLSAAPNRGAAAARALAALDSWARAGAMLGEVNRQGGYMREWALSAFALDYLKLRHAPGLEPGQKRSVAAWLLELGRKVDAHPPLSKGGPARNNHAYWCGLAVAAAGVAGDDRALYEAGLRRFELFVGELTPDGTLPLEMARGQRALHYHLYALDPLVMLAELAAANGADLYAAGERALPRLVQRVLVGLAQPSDFVRAAGVEQSTTQPSADELGWAEAYQARFAPPGLLTWLERARPVRCAYLGGDMTLSFSARVQDENAGAAP